MDLDYSPELTLNLRTCLERAAGRLGLPLADLELLGQDADVATRFIDAVTEGDAEVFLECLDRAALAQKRSDRIRETPPVVLAVRTRVFRPGAVLK